MTEQRKPPPIRVILPVVFALFSAISITVIFLLNLPWTLPLPLPWAMVMGVVLLAVGFPIMISALRSLRTHRALGDEIYMNREGSRLITTGAYAYTRNPLYLSATILFVGWSFVFTSTFLIIVTMLFLPLFRFAAKWEEVELTERFGDEYLSYKERVPFFFPRFPKDVSNLR